MRQRHLLLVASGLAVVVQTAFVAAYSAATGGCFCAITTSRPPPGPFATWTFEIGSTPLRQLLNAFPWEGAPQIGGAVATFIFAVINALPWTVGFFLLLNLIALPFRIRWVSEHGSRFRYTLADLHRVRPWCIAGAMALLVIAGLSAGAWARKQWIESAEHAIDSAVRSIRQGQPFHKRAGFQIACYDDCRAERFAGPYEFVLEEASLGTHTLDRFVAPVEMAGRLRAAGGARFHVNVYHVDGVWSVLMGQDDRDPAPDGEPRAAPDPSGR